MTHAYNMWYTVPLFEGLISVLTSHSETCICLIVACMGIASMHALSLCISTCVQNSHSINKYAGHVKASEYFYITF